MDDYQINSFEIDAILARLPALQTLTLSSMDLHQCPGVLTPASWHAPRSLKKLTLEHVSMYTDAQENGTVLHVRCSFVELLNLFSEIQTLHLTDSESDSESDSGPLPGYDLVAAALIKRTLRIRNLISNGCHGHWWMLLCKSGCLCFENLLSIDFLEHLGECDLFLQNVGHSLRSLSLSIGMCKAGNGKVRSISISTHTLRRGH